MTVYWNKKRYKVISSPYNGEVHAWMKDGAPVYTKPTSGRLIGFIFTDDGVVAVLRSQFVWVWILPLLCVLAGALMVSSTKETSYYPVAFAEKPIYSAGTLYCNVLNVHTETVTVQFATDRGLIPGTYPLAPGESLAHIDIAYIPTKIVYNGRYAFSLEVIYDGPG